jgi:hypothetical protein
VSICIRNEKFVSHLVVQKIIYVYLQSFTCVTPTHLQASEVNADVRYIMCSTEKLGLEMFGDLRSVNSNQAYYSQASWGRVEMKPIGAKKQRQKQR